MLCQVEPAAIRSGGYGDERWGAILSEYKTGEGLVVRRRRYGNVGVRHSDRVQNGEGLVITRWGYGDEGWRAVSWGGFAEAGGPLVDVSESSVGQSSKRTATGLETPDSCMVMP